MTPADIQRTRLDTLDHIFKVRRFLMTLTDELYERGMLHDQSKLEEPEQSGYAALQIRLTDCEYGTDEYRAALAEAGPTIAHHYAANRHHPEHWPGGVEDMTLIDIVEMLCDWKAASLRTKQGSILASIDHNEQRFKLSPQLAAILRNTVRELGW